jgi:hypothetical protein
LEQKIQTISARKQTGSNLWITVLVLCLVLTFVYMASDYFKQQRVQDVLRSQIAQKKTELAALPAPSSGLQERLTEAENTNQQIKTALSADYVDSTDVIAALLDTAADCHLKSSNLSTDKWNNQSNGESSYRVLPLNLDLSGTLSDVMIFLEKLETGHYFTALVVENISLAGIKDAGPSDLDQGVAVRLNALIVTRPEAKEN